MDIKNSILAVSPSCLRPIYARVEASPLACRLARGAFWSLTGAMLSRGLGLVSSILVARMLGKWSFGELGVIQSTIGMFGVFAGFGLGMTATRHVAEFRMKDPEKAGRIIAMSGITAFASGAIMATALYVFAPWLASRTLAAAHLTDLLRIGAGLLFLSALNGAQTGALAGFEAYKAIAHVNLLAGLITFPLMVGGAYYAGVKGAVYSLVISAGLNWLLNHLALRSEARRANVPLTLKGCGREISILYTFSLPAVLSGSMVGPVNWACNALLVNQSNGYAEMGVYNAAYIFNTVLLFIGSTVGTPLFSIISSENDTHNERLGRVNILLTWCIGLIPVLPLLSFPEIIQKIYGADYRGNSFSHTVALILFFTCIVLYKDGLARVLAARNLLWWGFLSNLFWGGVVLTGTFFLARFGSAGLAASFAVAYAVNTIVIVPLYVRRRLVPRDTLISLECSCIWLVLITMVLLVIVDASLPYRAVFFVIGTVITTISIFQLLHKREARI